jgi:hypothetical protein
MGLGHGLRQREIRARSREARHNLLHLSRYNLGAAIYPAPLTGLAVYPVVLNHICCDDLAAMHWRLQPITRLN